MNLKKSFLTGAAVLALLTGLLSPAACESVQAADENTKSAVKEVTLRVCNWEEYIDLGDWDDDETIELDSGDIIGENSMVEDFEEWYYETYGIKVNVEYSTFGTNEELYNLLTLGDVYDIVCPSEYMVMKLMAEDQLEPLSDDFFDTSDENNYYIRGVSDYIENIFRTKEINGEAWAKYMAGYMWGITGIVYNPEKVPVEDASTWQILDNPKYKCQVTVKDNVRDTYFAAVSALKHDLLTSEDFLNDPDYSLNLQDEVNDVSDETLQQVQDYLQDIKKNAYSFESDSGKADMVTGKVVANLQWSGDAVYTLDQAEEDDLELAFAVPEESTNIYFDGWVMLKKGVGGDDAKKHAAEAFMNFVSRPDNVVRNMYYIGYTSCISGTDDDNRIFEYAKYMYEAEDDEEDTQEYSLNYFFRKGDDNQKDYAFTAPTEQMNRQLFAAYPDEATIGHSSIMIYFDTDQNERINQMWIRVRCFNIHDVPVWAWAIAIAVIIGGAGFLYHKKRKKVY